MVDPVFSGAITEFEKSQLEELAKRESIAPTGFEASLRDGIFRRVNGYYIIACVIKGRDNRFWEVSCLSSETKTVNPEKAFWNIVEDKNTAWAISRSQSLIPWLSIKHRLELVQGKCYNSQGIADVLSGDTLRHLHYEGSPGFIQKRRHKEMIFRTSYGDYGVRFLKNFVCTLHTIDETDEDDDDGWSTLRELGSDGSLEDTDSFHDHDHEDQEVPTCSSCFHFSIKISISSQI